MTGDANIDILENIAKNRGFLLKSNIYDIDKARYLILKELKEGVIAKICLEAPNKEYIRLSKIN